MSAISPTSSEARPPADAGGAAAVSGPRGRLRGPFSVALFLLAALVLLDVSRKPESQLTARALLWGIDLYQATLSPRLPALGTRCRFTPTCSHYAEAVIRRHGAVAGSGRALWRIARCGPWTPAGTHDPP